MIYFCVKFQKDPLLGVNLTLFAPWLPWQRPPFWILFNPSKAATHYGGYSCKAIADVTPPHYFGTSVSMVMPFWIFFNTPKASTHYDEYSYAVSWSLMKGIQKKIKCLLFYFHGNCGKVCLTDSDFFGLSRSTICGFCSYQVSSSSVWRVTYYDHLCFSFFLAFLPFLWQRQPFWKKSTLKWTTSHGIWYSCKVS